MSKVLRTKSKELSLVFTNELLKSTLLYRLLMWKNSSEVTNELVGWVSKLTIVGFVNWLFP